jgi:hypothetical protein
MSNETNAVALKEAVQYLPAYIEGSLTEFWKDQGVTSIPVTPCGEGEEGFSWSEFINGLGRRTQERDDSVRE